MRFSVRRSSFGQRRGISSGGYVAIVALIVIIAALVLGLARLTIPVGSTSQTTSSSHSSSFSSHTTQTSGAQLVAVTFVKLISNCYPDPTTKCQGDSSNSTVRGVLQFKIYNPNEYLATLVKQPGSQLNPGAGISGPSWALSSGACSFTTGTSVLPRSTTTFSCNLTEPSGVIWAGDNYTWFANVDFSLTAPPGPNLFQQISGTILAVQG